MELGYIFCVCKSKLIVSGCFTLIQYSTWKLNRILYNWSKRITVQIKVKSSLHKYCSQTYVGTGRDKPECNDDNTIINPGIVNLLQTKPIYSNETFHNCACIPLWSSFGRETITFNSVVGGNWNNILFFIRNWELSSIVWLFTAICFGPLHKINCMLNARR